jgi:hypothetical protein
MSETTTLTGAEAVQGLIDTKAKLARLAEWRSSFNSIEAAAERTRMHLEAHERMYLAAISTIAKENPTSFGSTEGLTPAATAWLDHHGAAVEEAVAEAESLLARMKEEFSGD